MIIALIVFFFAGFVGIATSLLHVAVCLLVLVGDLMQPEPPSDAAFPEFYP
jgi:hypothetical protein